MRSLSLPLSRMIVPQGIDVGHGYLGARKWLESVEKKNYKY